MMMRMKGKLFGNIHKLMICKKWTFYSRTALRDPPAKIDLHRWPAIRLLPTQLYTPSILKIFDAR
jgi:hypothetical protein